MKQLTKLFILSLLFSLTLLACSRKDPNGSVIIEKIYATSQASPSDTPTNLFIPGKSWHSAPSTRLMEGVMLYFLRPDAFEEQGSVRLGEYRIHHLKVSCKGLFLQYYVNGSPIGSGKCGEKVKLRPPGQLLSSLFIEANQKSPSPEPLEIQQIEFLDSEGKPLPVIYPEPVPGELRASSVQSPASAYRPAYLFDGRREFGWVEGAKGDGVGEFVEIKTDRKLRIRGLEIYPGYQRSEVHFAKNGTPLKITFSTPERNETVSLKDESGSFRSLFDTPLEGKEFKFTLAGVRTGSVWKDTVISELVLLGPDGERYTVEDRNYGKELDSLRKKIAGGMLSRMAGRRIVSEDENGTSYKMVVRENGSFVIWKKSQSTTELPSGEEEGERRTVEGRSSDILMDGNWLLEKNDAQEAEIKIFGKRRELLVVNTTSYGPDEDPYKTKNRHSEEEKIKIFSDRLTLIPGPDPDSVEIRGSTVEGLFR